MDWLAGGWLDANPTVVGAGIAVLVVATLVHLLRRRRS